MAYRDDREALLARADALEHDRELLARELEQESSANEQLERKLAETERALVRARKAARPPNRRAPIVIAAIVLAGGAFLLVMMLRGSTRGPDDEQVVSAARNVDKLPASPVDAAPTAADIERRAMVSKDAAYRSCLDRVDHLLRAVWLEYQSTTARDELARWEHWTKLTIEQMEECVDGLEHHAAREPTYGATDDLALRYAGQLRAFADGWRSLARYRDVDEYRDDDGSKGRAVHAQLSAPLALLIQTSEQLRVAHAPQHAAVVADTIARLQAVEGTETLYWIEVLRERAVSLVDLVALSTTSSAVLEAAITDAVGLSGRAERALADDRQLKRAKAVTSRLRAVIEAAKRLRTRTGEVEREVLTTERRGEFVRIVAQLHNLLTQYDALAARLEEQRQRDRKVAQ